MQKFQIVKKYDLSFPTPLTPLNRAQVPFYGEKVGSQNYLVATIGIYLYSAALKSDTSSWEVSFDCNATDPVILNHGQVTWMAPELAPPLLTTTPHQRKDVSALDRFNVHRCPSRRVFSGTGLELVTRQTTIRYLYHSATVAVLFGEERRQ
ncbi:uncharacterized protein TNCV_4829521 [Trichonephila clavipes]|nr:uncharacterized protein TNCV_4829521 [Trichonephila clavipes]